MSCQAVRPTIFVKLGRQGGRIIEYAVPADSLVSDVLYLGQLFPLIDSERVYRNGNHISTNIPVNDKDVLFIQRECTIGVKVGRINQPVININVTKDTTVAEVLYKAIVPPIRPTEEVWFHADVLAKGILLTSHGITIVPNGIYVVEPRKTIKDKILSIISVETEDVNGGWERATLRICELLRAEYNIR